MRDEVEAMITIKLDKKRRVCVWMGNVQKLIYTDKNDQLMVKGRDARARYDFGPDRSHIMSQMTRQEDNLLMQGMPIVIQKNRIYKSETK